MLLNVSTVNVDPITIVETIAAVFVEMVLPIRVEKLNDPSPSVDALNEDTTTTTELILLPTNVE